MVAVCLQDNIGMHLELVFVRGEERDCWLRCRDQKRVILQVDAYFFQVTVDHGLQLWNFWSSSPGCDVVSLANPLDRGSLPWHISYVIVEQGRWQLWSFRDAGADDSGARLGTFEASCSMSPSQVAGQPSSDGARKGRSGNLGNQCVMRHCIKLAVLAFIKDSCQVYGHRHCTVRWFPLVEACLDVCCELEEGRCSRVSGSEAVLIFSWWEKLVDIG